MILAGDVGATKILLEVGEVRSGRWNGAFARRYPVEGAVNFGAVLAEFLREWEEEKPTRAKRIRAAGVGVAGPASGNKVKMTNRPWSIDGDSLGRRFGIPRVRVVNDLAASAYGIEWLEAKDLVSVQPGKAVAEAPRVVIGVGTGLGVAYLVVCNGELQVVPGEGGHMNFGPNSPEQARLWEALFRSRGRVEIEDIVSGRGLSNIYEALRREGDAPTGAPGPLEASAITEAALSGRDKVAVQAINLFTECLGSVAGDFALAAMAQGGVYLSGGVTPKLRQLFDVNRFRKAFCAKGAFSATLMKMPVKLVTSEALPVLGAARFAVEG